MIAELYRSMDDWLVDQNSDIRASEVQGLLAGLMAANIQVRPEEYVARLAEYADLQPGCDHANSRHVRDSFWKSPRELDRHRVGF